MLECIKTTLLASMNGYPPQLAVEFGRKVLFSAVRPTFVSWKSTSGRPSPPARPDGAAGHEHRKHHRVVIRRKKVRGGGPRRAAGRSPTPTITAMMAFFLVMWLISIVPREELKGIAEYFRMPLRVALTGGQQLGRDQRRAWRWPRSAAQRWRRAPRPGQPGRGPADGGRPNGAITIAWKTSRKRLENVIENSPVLRASGRSC